MRAIWVRLLALGWLGFAGCNTPSVPIPPPQLPELHFRAGPSAGMVVLEGMPTSSHSLARFYVYNQTAADGVISTAAADGSFTTSPFPGVANDTVEIYFDLPDGRRSASVCVELQVGSNLFSVACF